MFFTDAFNKAMTLLTALLMMAVLLAVLRLPESNLLLVVFTFLASALLFDVPEFRMRCIYALKMAVYAAAAQLLTGITWQTPFLRIVFLSLYVFFTLITLPDRQGACAVLLCGYLGYFAPGGTMTALYRCIDFVFSAVIILLAASFSGIVRLRPPEQEPFKSPCSAAEAFVITSELAAGAILIQLLRLSQGAWIMMTIVFIQMAANPRHPVNDLALQRIFAIPAGILLGGLYLGIFCRFDYRFVYLLPFTGTAAFFTYYSRGNYFLFSLLFIFSLTLFSDWLTGTYHRNHFADIMLARCFATLAGSFLAIAGEFFLKEEKTV